MRRIFAALTVLLLLSGVAPVARVGRAAQPAPPNVVLILLDDARVDDLRAMPQTRKLLAAQGTSFDRAYVTNPICCPSRASILTGRYVHNHSAPTIAGAFPAFRRDHEAASLGPWLRGAGYRTGFVGKYFVSYPEGAPQTYVPPGWNTWAADIKGGYSNYDMNINRRVVHYGESIRAYRTDVEQRNTLGFLNGALDAGGPFFLYLAPKAPHSPADPAPRHRRAAVPEPRAPRVPSYNEADVSDKPAYVRRIPRFGGPRVRGLDAYHIARQRTLLATDQMVTGIVNTLANRGALDNTHVVFTSDNGYLLGEHRIEGKNVPYEGSIRVPLIVRGPGVPAGRTDAEHLVTLADLAPTFAAWAGTTAPGADGRSLVPLLGGAPDPAPWRTALMAEHQAHHLIGPSGNFTQGRYAIPPSWSAIRTADRLYVEYDFGFRELYDTDADPHQLRNLAYLPERGADVAALADRLDALRRCAGASCRAAEAG